jgi:hypothetical protein
VLRLSFRAGSGESPKLIHSTFVRFCVDGTIRGPDDYVIARRADSGWWVAGSLHRIVECEGPLYVRITGDRLEPARNLGPFDVLSTSGDLFYGDQDCLHLPVPGSKHANGPVRQLTLISEGVTHGKTELPARQATEGGRPQGAAAGKTAAQAGPHGRNPAGGRR